jgi:hypothetical protein
MQKKDNREKAAERGSKQETPFFARYLEGQKSLKVKTNLKAGPATLKYPSDRDEWEG